MELAPSIVPLHLEPVQQLDVYFRSLGDVSEALAGFERLADLVLASEHDEPECSSPSVAFQGPSSPGGQSSASSVNCCASCTCKWPTRGYNSSSAPSSAAASFVSSSIYSSSSSGSSSFCNSSTYDFEAARSPASERHRASSGRGANRRRRNATAAERYRKKLKGRRFGLVEELEQEQERNERLRRNLEAKLVLYREFADLLAQNTHDERDCDLADLGSRSLSNILEHVCPAASSDERHQLERLLAHFRQVQHKSRPVSPAASLGHSAAAAQAGSHAALDEFECDFYSDRLLPRAL